MSPLSTLRPGRAFFFALLATIAWTAAWLISTGRSSYFEQLPNWDWANYHSSSLLIKIKMEQKGWIAGLWDGWTTAAGSHTPFVQLTSALLMFIFGESRFVIESVLILYTFVWAWATFRGIELFMDTKTAAWSVALSFTFPVFIVVSQVFLLEHPMSAFFSLSLWMLLRSEGFSKWGPSILFGVFSGLACVTRLMGFVYFVGPAVVGFAWILQRPNKSGALLKYGIAGAVSMAICISWYLPNYEAVRAYVGGVTFGSRAQAFTGGSSIFSFDTLSYYFLWILYEGPGVPLAIFLGLVGIVVTASRHRALVWNRPMFVLLAVFLLDFLAIFPSGQRVGARYFLPLMPILAVLIIQILRAIPWGSLRAIAIVITGAASLAHPLMLTFFFEVPATRMDGYGQEWAGGSTLWNHRPLFLDLAQSVELEPRADLKVGEVVSRIESANPAPNAKIFVMSGHPFMQVHSIRFEAIRRRHSWTWGAAEILQLWNDTDFEDRVADEGRNYDLIVLRTGGINYQSTHDYGPIAERLVRSARVGFDQVGEPVYLGDGSIVRVYKRRSPIGQVGRPESIPQNLNVTFLGRGESFTLVGSEMQHAEDTVVFTIYLRTSERMKALPIYFVHFFESANRDRGIGGIAAESPFPLPADFFKGSGPWYFYFRFELPEALMNTIKTQKMTVQWGLGFLYGDPRSLDPEPERLRVRESTGRADVDNNGTRILSNPFQVTSSEIIESRPAGAEKPR